MTYERTYGHYRRRMKQIVVEIQKAVGDGDTGDPTNEHGIDVSLMLEDAVEFDGDEEKGKGTFSIRAIRFGGEILAHFVPYNYTESVWTQLSRGNYPELDARLNFIEDAARDIAELVRAGQTTRRWTRDHH